MTHKQRRKDPTQSEIQTGIAEIQSRWDEKIRRSRSVQQHKPVPWTAPIIPDVFEYDETQKRQFEDDDSR